MAKKVIRDRLENLKREYDIGRKNLTDLEAKQFNLQETLLRISGAIQVLEEILADLEQQRGISARRNEGIFGAMYQQAPY